MQSWGAILAVAAIASTAAAENVLSDLFYTTATPCAALRALPTYRDLRTQLLSHDEPFQGSVTLSKSDTKTGCALHLAVRGELDTSEKAHDAFALTRHVDASFGELLDAHAPLRGASKQLNDLTFQRVRVKLGNRDFSVDAAAVGGAATGDVTLNGDECGDFASKELLKDLLVAGTGDVAVVTGQVDVAKCAIGLDITGRAPTVGSTHEAVAFLKTVDKSLDEWFGASATKQSTATLRNARMAFSPSKSAVLEAAKPVELAAYTQINAPTKQTTMGILMGLVMLTAMLVGIAYQKKRHEQSQQQRHDNASRAAQFRRVSYRLGYGPVPNKETELSPTDEEKSGLL
jgi:hypothetical protein